MPPAAFIASAGATPAIGGTGATSLTALVPSTVQPGDTLLFVVAANDLTTGDVSPSSLPAGWSVLGRLATATRVVNVLRRVATDTEPASHTIVTVGTTGLTIATGGVLLVYRGLDVGAAPVSGGIVDVAASIDFACPSLTLAAYSDLYLGIAMNATVATFTPPAGGTERFEALSNVALEVFEVLKEAIGATGTQTATISAPSNAPASSAAMTTACGGFGTWSAGWLCEDAATPLVGSFGSTNLVESAAGGSPVYQVPGPLGDKAVRVTVANTGWAAASTAFLDADSTMDICGAVVMRTLLPLSQTTTILSKTDFAGGPGFELLITTTAVTFNVDHTAPGNVTATATVPETLSSNEWFVVMFGMDRGAGTLRVAIRSLMSGSTSIGASQSLGGLGSISNAGAPFCLARGG